MSATARILDRLQRVKQTGPARWVARCPAHDDRSPSLSIRETDDGRVLVHDFGGCDTEAVLAALGLEFRDLFEKSLQHHIARTTTFASAREVLELIDHEVIAATLIIAAAAEGGSINDLGWQRLADAAGRIGAARDMVCPATLKD